MASLKTLLIITISTARLIFPGVPGAPGITEIARPPAVKSISFELASDAAASKDSKASITVPEGLKAGKSLDLQIDLTPAPKPSTTPTESKLSLYEYWGSSREVATSQPKVGRPKSPDSETTPGIPTTSFASWPGMDSPAIADAAATPGDYSLKTDYCGSTAFTLTSEQDFLAPVNITSAASEPDLDKPIVIKWRPVPNAVGYLIKAFGGQGTKTVTWTSAAKPELADGIEYRPIGKDELDKFIQSGVLVPSYAITATIPAGIFKGSPSVMLVMTAFGRDLTQVKDGIDTQVIVRSTASFPLHSTPIKLRPSKPKNADRVIPSDDE